MTDARGQVVTFYSFKGGTGRTMALANIAWILAANGKQVLVADWDLESPGLHRFFRPFLNSDAIDNMPGVIDLFREYENHVAGLNSGPPSTEDWLREKATVGRYAFPLRWQFPGGGRLDFLSAGRQNPLYTLPLSAVDWDNFYDRLGGTKFLEALQQDMKSNYDYTLIDSRTGLSDVADICTIHLPDCLVDCFTFSEQGIEGAARVGQTVAEYYRHRNIRVLPVPMRVDQAEKEKADISRTVARRRFAEIRDGIPAGMTEAQRAKYWGSVEVPYQAFYAYEEVLATFGDSPGVGSTLLNAFENLTDHITQGAVTSLPPMDESLRKREVEKFRRRAELAEEEIILKYTAQDGVWAEWIDSLLSSAGMRVTRALAGAGPILHPSGLRMVAVISSEEAAVNAGILPLSSQLNASDVVVVYASKMRQVPGVRRERSVPAATLTEANAADQILRLLGLQRPGGEKLNLDARFPGTEPLAFHAPARNAWFTGRDAALQELRSMLSDAGATASPVALLGMGGVGKTNMALEYVHRYRSAYDVVWWISADPHQFIDTKLSDLLTRLGLSSGKNPVESSQLMLQALSQGEPSDRWLIVFDNAEEVLPVTKFLPKGRGHTLITSRDRTWDTYARALDVKVFERNESVHHLRRRLNKLSLDEADQIAHALGDLPIAIYAAGELLVGTGTPVNDYLVQIESTPVGIASVLPTWNLALERLAESARGAHRLLQLLSVIAAESEVELIYSDEMAQAIVPYDPVVTDRHMVASLVQQLNRLGLVRVERLDEQRSEVQVHRLLQRVVKDRMSKKELDDARHDMHKVLASSRPREEMEDPSSHRRFRLLWPHVLTSEAVNCHTDNVRDLLIDRIRYLWFAGDYAQGEEQATKIIADWGRLLEDRSAFDGDADALRRQWLQLQFNLANILRSQAKYEQARALDSKVKAEQQALLGPGPHLHTLMTSGGLAADLRGLGRYAEALEMDKASYPQWQGLLGTEHPRTLTAANNLAASHRLMGQFAEAIALDEFSLSRREALLPDGHPYTTASKANLGRDYRDAGEYQKSVELLTAAHEEISQSLGPDGFEAYKAQANLAVSLRAAGFAAQAMPLLHSAYERLSSALGTSNIDTLACRLSRAVNLLAMDDYERADKEIRAVIYSYTDILGGGHPHTLVCHSSHAAIMRKLHDLPTARAIAENAAIGLSRILSEDHPFTVGARMNQAICLAEEGALAEAAKLMENAVERLDRTIGRSHPDALRGSANLALIHKAINPTGPQADPAHPIGKLAEKLGRGHPSVVALENGDYAHRIIEPHPF